MKTYIVYVDGVEQAQYVRAGSHNAAEKKAKKKYPNKDVSVTYTEIWHRQWKDSTISVAKIFLKHNLKVKYLTDVCMNLVPFGAVLFLMTMRKKIIPLRLVKFNLWPEL